MFRQGGVGTTSLYSPAGTSDSSGFSEQRDQSFSPAPGGQPTASGYLQQNNITNETVRLGPTGALFSLQQQNGYRAADNSAGFEMRPNVNFSGAGAGKGSPTMGHFSYHNPALTASPYSTLPRRPGVKSIGGRNILQDNNGQTINSVTNGPISYSNSGDKHSPLMLELGSLNSFRGGQTSSLERKQNPNFSSQVNAIPHSSPSRSNKVATVQRVTAKTPLLEDDRESCV